MALGLRGDIPEGIYPWHLVSKGIYQRGYTHGTRPQRLYTREDIPLALGVKGDIIIIIII